MKVVATRAVYYQSEKYEAGDIIDCNDRDFEKILQPLGCEIYQEPKSKTKKTDRAIKEVTERTDD
tara:strand:+ start:723 stop:917 length:195 start_codon:yes stop_codon:yes gene_type:complete